ncbi:MAG: NUDIX domain-containing protein [Patescibacteria group bacterium]
MESVRTRSAGGIVIGDGGTVALVQSRNSHMWMFPKGHIDPGESDEDAARREIMEEAGLDNLELLDDLGEYERPRLAQDGTEAHDEMKVIKMFLFAAVPHATLNPSHEMQDAKWVSFRELADAIASVRDRAWLATVAPRVREAIQRD